MFPSTPLVKLGTKHFQTVDQFLKRSANNDKSQKLTADFYLDPTWHFEVWFDPRSHWVGSSDGVRGRHIRPRRKSILEYLQEEFLPPSQQISFKSPDKSPNNKRYQQKTTNLPTIKLSQTSIKSPILPFCLLLLWSDSSIAEMQRAWIMHFWDPSQWDKMCFIKERP